MRKVSLWLPVLAIAVGSPAVKGDVFVAPGGGTPGTSQNFELVGHDPLFDRGMNAAPAIFEKNGRTFVYIGNRSDGSSTCGVGDPRRAVDVNGCPHPHPGILILDATDPSDPTVVGEIGPPDAGLPGITTRELRVWPDKALLMVMTFACSSLIHACPATPPGFPNRDAAFPFDIKFFDLSDPVHPRFLQSHVTRSMAGLAIKPHEFYLWIDPKNANRALLWESTPTASADPARPNLLIEDISDVPNGGPVRLVAQGNWNNQFENGGSPPSAFDFDLALHSMAPTADGKLTHIAHLRGNYLALDTSNVANNQIPPGEVVDLNGDLITQPADRPRWGAGNNCAGHTAVGCAESHSAVPVPGRSFELNVDEVYGTFADPSFGWPWAWVRLINVLDPAHPTIVGEYKIFQQTEAFRPQVDPATEQFTSFGSHNPTVLPQIAFDSWHSGGLQAIDIADPTLPGQAGWFSPTPLESVANEDPALSRGPNKVVVWSYPIIKGGLIFVVDIRNGLYILRYTGKGAADVGAIKFFEGNSNRGDALRLAGLN
jgi:hypothetical protein